MIFFFFLDIKDRKPWMIKLQSYSENKNVIEASNSQNFYILLKQ